MKGLEENKLFVSIIIPCRNEKNLIGKCLDSIVANSYSKDKLEVLVIDGLSEDGTREVIKKFAEKYSFVRLLDNPKKITPVALNIGIKNARGEIITRMDAHTTYEKDYVAKCLRYLKKYNADNVGGIWKILPQEKTLVGEAIVFALSHPFGVGNAYYRFTPKEPKWVDTVPFFCCKKEIFDKVGFFNENLARGQDMELNLRLKRAGGKILLVPEITSYYYARSNLKDFFRHNFKNGVWAILPFKFTKYTPVSWRHLIPLVFVVGLLGSLMLASFFFWGKILFFLIFGSYLLLVLLFSLKISYEKGLKYLFAMPIIFAALHISYGLGSIWGLVKVLTSGQFWRKSTI